MKQSQVDTCQMEGLGCPGERALFHCQRVPLEIQPVPLQVHFVWNDNFLEMFSLYTRQSRFSLVEHMVWISRESRGKLNSVTEKCLASSFWWLKVLWKTLGPNKRLGQLGPSASHIWRGWAMKKILEFVSDLCSSHSPATRRLCDPNPSEPKFPHL